MITSADRAASLTAHRPSPTMRVGLRLLAEGGYDGAPAKRVAARMDPGTYVFGAVALERMQVLGLVAMRGHGEHARVHLTRLGARMAARCREMTDVRDVEEVNA